MLPDHLYSRRLFLSRGVQLLSAAATLPLFLERSAHCLAADFAANPQGAGRNDRILVVVQLAGGNDGLNTVIPIRNDDYYRARPRIGIGAKDALRIDEDYGLHPAATGFKKLLDAGDLAILHSVGYPNPNRSHFRGTDIWATAQPEITGTTGWLGRYFDNCCCGQDPGPDAAKGSVARAADASAAQPVAARLPASPAAANGSASPSSLRPSVVSSLPLPASPRPRVPPSASHLPDPSSALALTAEVPTTLQGQRFQPIAIRSPDSLTYAEGRRDHRLMSAFDRLNDADHTPPATQPAAANDFLQRSALNARVYADTIRKSMASAQSKATYPATRFAADLKLTAQMIAAGLPTRVFYVQLGGFDTHGDELPRHQKLMDELSNGLAAFVDDLKALGHFDRTLVMTFSEFGRRVAENGSAGTDHGEAAPLFVVGSRLIPGLHGVGPNLAPNKLNRGDVAFTLDFRSLYATVLKQWLAADDAKILGAKFPQVELFKKA